MAKGTVDVAWRGLNGAAITRFSRQIAANPGALTDDGYTLQGLTGTRIRMLQWSPGGHRTVEPAGPPGDRRRAAGGPHPGLDRAGRRDRPRERLPDGRQGRSRVTWSNRIPLSLSYDPTIPDGRDQANQIRTRLEDTGGFSVRLRPGEPDADLTLVDRKAFTATGLSWLQPYLANSAAGDRRHRQHLAAALPLAHATRPRHSACWVRCSARRPWTWS